MRNLVLLGLAVAVLAAGCTQTPAPTAPSGSSTEQQPNEGIAVGEPNPNQPGGMQGGMLVRPAHGDNTTDGLRIAGDESASGFARGGSVEFTYTVANEGADAVTWGGCYVPQSFDVLDADGNVHQLQPPMAQCMGFTENPFPAGAKMDFNTTWDGTWAVGDHLEQAPEGSYTFEAHFKAYREGTPVTVTLGLPVNIVAMGAL